MEERTAENTMCKLCANRAYYVQKNAPSVGFCGRHVKVATGATVPLVPVDLRAVGEEHRRGVVPRGPPGTNTLSLQRILMLRTPALRPGAVMLFPNNRHGNHALAHFDCAALSPMRLGPVEHGQPDLPPSLNIENFHQGTKVYREEADAEGNPTALYYRNRLAYYLDPVPHRHKYMGADKANRNKPLYFLWVDKERTEHRLTYVESRQFYCAFYERLASARPEFARIKDMLAAGYDVEICGYDGFPFAPTNRDRNPTEAEVHEAYMDHSRPFGHERVLAAMLLGFFPWRLHKTFEF